MVRCGECKWWKQFVGANGTILPDGACLLAETDFNARRVHEESLAYAVSGEEATLCTMPSFGCTQGESMNSQVFKMKVSTALADPHGDLFAFVPKLDGEMFEDGCEVIVTVERKHKKAAV